MTELLIIWGGASLFAAVVTYCVGFRAGIDEGKRRAWKH